MLDHGALLRSGMGVVPDFAEEEAKKQLLAIQMLNAQTNRDQESRLLAGDQRKVERQVGFGEAFNQWLEDPTMDGMSRLIAAYPEYHDQVRQVNETRSKEGRATDRRELANAFGALANGRTDVAIGIIQKRREADAAAGQDASDEVALLEMLQSDDPDQHRRARGMLAYELANTLGEAHFSAGLDRMLETMKLPAFEEYAQALGLEPGTDEHRTAMKDYVLRGSGPTAHGYDVALEGARQDNRVALEGVRQGNRRDLQRERPSSSKGDGKPKSEAAIYADIMDRWRRGGAINNREREFVRSYEQRRTNRGRGSSRTRGGSNAAIIRNPQTGERMVLQGGKWVPMGK